MCYLLHFWNKKKLPFFWRNLWAWLACRKRNILQEQSHGVGLVSLKKCLKFSISVFALNLMVLYTGKDINLSIRTAHQVLIKKKWNTNASWPFAHRTLKCKKQWCLLTICSCTMWWNVPSQMAAGNQIYIAYPFPDSLGTDEVFCISTARCWEQHSSCCSLCTPHGAQTSLLYYELYYDFEKKLNKQKTEHRVFCLTPHTSYLLLYVEQCSDCFA